MLFKEKYFERFMAGVAGELLICSRNAAIGVLVIWDVVRTRFYEQDVAKIVNAIEDNLNKDNLLRAIQLDLSKKLKNLLKKQDFEILICKFFEYYYSRLPVLFKINIIQRNGKIRKLSAMEKDLLKRTCYQRWVENYPQMAKSNVFSSGFKKFVGLTKWYVKSERRDDEIYNVDWLMYSLDALYPEIFADDNVGNITKYVIESCFPMFWDKFQNLYRLSIELHSAFGHLVGELTIEELSSNLRKGAKKQKLKSNLKLCPSCHAFQDQASKVCPNCGYDLTNVELHH